MEKTIDTIAVQIARETHAADSIEISITLRQELLVVIGSKPPRTKVIRENFIATARGQKFYRRSIESGGSEQTIWAGYSDGNRCASVEYSRPPHEKEQKTITITKTFMDEQLTGYTTRPEPIRFHYVGLIPLYEAITTAERAGRSLTAGRASNVFIFRAVPGTKSTQDLVYHLDDQTSVPIKVEAFANESRRVADKPSWVWEALTLDEVQGFHVPLRSRYKSFIVRDTSASQEKMIEDYTINTVQFNENHPASKFWPVQDNGVFINDLIAKKFYYNTPDKKAPPSEPIATVGQLLVAEQPTDMTPYFSGAGVALATVALAAAVYWKVRRG
jgi:hypothetical protein